MAINRQIESNVVTTPSTNTSSASYQLHNTLNFTADASKDYYVIASALGNLDSVTADLDVILVDDTAGLATVNTNLTPHDVNNYHSMHQFFIMDWGASGSQDVAVYHKPGAASLTSTLQDSRLLVIEAHADDEYAQNGTTQTTSSTSYVTKGSVTLNPPSSEDYIVLVMAHVNIDTLSRALDVQMYDGTTSYSGQAIRFNNTSDWQGYASVFRVSGVSSSTTLSFQMKVNDVADVGSVKDLVIIAMPASSFANSYHAEELTRQATNLTSYVTELTLTDTVATATDHLVFASGFSDALGNTYANDFILTDGGTTKFNGIVEPDIGSGNDDESWFYCAYESYSAGSRTWTVQQKKSVAGLGGVGMDDMTIVVLEPDTVGGRILKLDGAVKTSKIVLMG